MATSWFYVEGKERVGPVSEDVLRKLIADQLLNGDSYVWKKGFENWARLKEVDELQSFLEPGNPVADNLGEEVTFGAAETGATTEGSGVDWTSFTNTPDEKVFFVRQDERASVYGPYSLNILLKLFQENRVSGKTHLFVPGSSQWLFLGDIPIYEEFFGGPRPEIKEGERKSIKKKPLVALVLSPSGQEATEGLIRDVSVGGMQVLAANFPGRKGEEVQLKLEAGGEMGKCKLKGKVARVLDGDQGAFVRFTDVTDEARNFIEHYLNSEDHP